MEIVYDYDSKIEFTSNITYLDQRNNAKFEDGLENIVYQDRLKNAPYLLANAGVNFNLKKSGIVSGIC